MLAFFRAAFRRKSRAEWLRELGSKDICFGPVNDVEEAFADPQLRHRGMVVEMETPSGPTRFFRCPIHLSETPPSVRTPPPAFGGDTEAVLRELGFTDGQIAVLREQGVV
jgi:crotonobetainyl-CoA:carnitine CoA-transferase CaiB-like acyl-CoA transferase